MKKIFFLFIFSNIALAYFGFKQTPPEDFGEVKTVKEYLGVFTQKESLNINNINERTKGMVDACRQEFSSYGNTKGKYCYQNPNLTFPCNDLSPSVSGNIKYCADVKEGVFRLSVDVKTFFNSTFKLESDYETYEDEIMPKVKNMFYSAVNCMEASYLQQGIVLDVNIIEVSSKEESDLEVIDAGNFGPHLRKIPMGLYSRFHSHAFLCQLVTHEISHHLGLPDRYQRYVGRKKCDRQPVYPRETLMAMDPRDGYNGLGLHDHDVQDLLYNFCPKTVIYFNKNPDVVCIKDMKKVLGEIKDSVDLSQNLINIIADSEITNIITPKTPKLPKSRRSQRSPRTPKRIEALDEHNGMTLIRLYKEKYNK